MLLHVITSLRTGGAEKLMVDLLPRLRGLGNEVELCVFDGIRTSLYNDLAARGITIHSLSNSMYSVWNVIRLIRLVKRYDIIHVHNTPCQFALALLHPFIKATLFTTEHNSTNRRRNKWYWYLLDKWMYRQYKCIICISEDTKHNFVDYIGSDEKTITIHNGIDIKRFIDATPAPRFINGDVKISIMVSAFRRQKDQRTAIRAYQHLPKKYHLLLAGSGEKQIINECKQLTKDLGLEDRVHFLGVRQNIPELLKMADVVILSSHYEGLSLSSIEGMASGTPFIASDVAGLREIVKDAGILFPEGDDKTLANHIERLTADSEYAHMISQRCQEKAKQYDIQSMANEYNMLYNT